MIHALFGIVYVGLWILFWLTLLSPGNAQTAWIFDVLAPVQSILSQAFQVVGYPVIWLCNWVMGFLPGSVTPYFPTTTIQTLMQGLVDLFSFIPGVGGSAFADSVRNFDYNNLFPGTLDFRILLTLGLVLQVERLLTRPLGTSNVSRKKSPLPSQNPFR